MLTFDHRGVGRSSRVAPLRNQTAEQLAADALALVNAVWGDEAPVHVYGWVRGPVSFFSVLISFLVSSLPQGAAHHAANDELVNA